MKQWVTRASLLTVLAVSLCACSSALRDGAPSTRINASRIPDAIPTPLPKSKYGNPKSYEVAGKTYHVLPTSRNYQETGIASWYGTKFHGRLTSTREKYDMFAMTAASPVLPIPSFARVTNLSNGRSVVVKVNDRGPFAKGRIMDLSYAAAKKLGYADRGTARVEVKAINIDRPGSELTQPQLYLQVASYSNFHQAQLAAEQIQSSLSYSEARIQPTKVHRRTWYRVQLGPLRSERTAGRLTDAVQEMGFEGAYTVVG